MDELCVDADDDFPLRAFAPLAEVVICDYHFVVVGFGCSLR